VKDADGPHDAAGIIVIRKRVKTARIQVLPNGTLRVTAPPSLDVAPFLDRHAGWIEERRKVFSDLAEEGRGREDMLLLLGRYYRLENGRRCGIDEETQTVTSPSLPALKRHLGELLKADVIRLADRHRSLGGEGFHRITVRMQRTVWATCSSRRNLSVNLRTIALPDPLREYIVIHELAHTLQHNHSPAFWTLVRAARPDYRRAQAELKRYWVLLERNRVWKGIGTAGRQKTG